MSTRFQLWLSVAGTVLAVNVASGGDAIEHRLGQARHAFSAVETLLAKEARLIGALLEDPPSTLEEPPPRCRTKVRIRRPHDETRVAIRRRGPCGAD